jgi:hypothetical protein
VSGRWYVVGGRWGRAAANLRLLTLVAGGEEQEPSIRCQGLRAHACGVGNLRFQTHFFTQVEHWMRDEFRTTSVGASRPCNMATLAKTKVAGGRIDAEISHLRHR